MPSLENLKDILREVEGLKNSDEYSLRIAATLAQSGLLRLEDPNVRASVVREILSRIRGITKFYVKADPNIARIYTDLGLWHDRFFPGPRPMEENPADDLVFIENSNTNPITLPDGDSVPGSVVHMFAKEHRYSREFAEEMEETLAAGKDYEARSEEDVHLYLMHIAAEVRMKGTILHAPPRIIDRAKHVLRMKEIPYDRYPVAFGAVIWVPKDTKEEATQALREAGYIQEAR